MRIHIQETYRRAMVEVMAQERIYGKNLTKSKNWLKETITEFEKRNISAEEAKARLQGV